MRIHMTAVSRFSIVTAAVFLIMLMEGEPRHAMALSIVKQETQQLEQKTEPIYIKVVLERVYLDGEISEEVVNESVQSLEDVWNKYDQWQLTEMKESEMVFRQQIDDISPLLKANGFFGITNNGVLSIFNGKPDHSKIIQSFFQIDIKKLESNKQKELIRGIPIKNKDRYVQVLETFKAYSTSDKQKN